MFFFHLIQIESLVEERVFLNRSVFRDAERLYTSKDVLAALVAPVAKTQPAQQQQPQPAAPAAAAPAPAKKEEDDFDLFEEEEETEEKRRIKEERLAAYASKKEKSIFIK